jgi:hypothetical protein
MATGFPASTGDVLSAAMYNGLTSFTIGAAQTADYTAVSADQFQALQIMDKATAIAFTVKFDRDTFISGTKADTIKAAVAQGIIDEKTASARVFDPTDSSETQPYLTITKPVADLTAALTDVTVTLNNETTLVNA